MSAQSAAIRLTVTVSFLAAACTTNKVVPATDSHAADHAMPPSSASNVSTTDTRGLPPDASGALAATERTVQRGNRYPMTVTDFKKGSATMATLVQIGRLGHAWSGGASNEHFSDRLGPDASRMVWGFASKQFGDTGSSRRASPQQGKATRIARI